MVLYHQVGEGAIEVEAYAREYARRQPGHKLELVSLETPRGAQLAALYGVNEYPAVLAINDDNGSLLRLWQGSRLPLMSELTGYSA